MRHLRLPIKIQILIQKKGLLLAFKGFATAPFCVMGEIDLN